MGCVLQRALCCRDNLDKELLDPDSDYAHPMYLKKQDHNNLTRKTGQTNPVNSMYSMTEGTSLESSNHKEYRGKLNKLISNPNIVLNDIEFNKNVHSLSEVKIRTSAIVLKAEGLPSDFYEKLRLLGEGAYGVVYQVEHKLSHEIRAMKVIPKHFLNESYSLEDIEREIQILKNLDHPNILKIYEFFVDEMNIYIVTEFCSEGSLFDKLENVNILNEFIVKLIMVEILSAVAYLHSQNVIHGDLKLENVMIEKLSMKSQTSFNTSVLLDQMDIDKDVSEVNVNNLRSFSNFGIKLIDFGCSKVFKAKRHLKGVIGTLTYNAPEVLRNKFNEKSDLWACGVIMYMLLSGHMPFFGDSDEEIERSILRGQVTFDHSEFNKVSSLAKECISKLLTYDNHKRPSALEILSHPYFNSSSIFCPGKDDLDSKKILNNLRKYSAHSKFHQAVLTFITHNFVKKEEISNLRKIFKQIDKNCDGRLSKEELYQSYNTCGLDLDKSEIDALVKQLDDDNNGYIEYEEFIRATIDKKSLLTEINLKQAFDLFDKDKSGEITLDEIKGIIGQNLPEDVANELLAEIHKKEGEYITYQEFLELMNELAFEGEN